MKRTPRKKKKLIPKDTPYCYTPKEYYDNGGYSIIPCPFYKHIDSLEGYCKLVKDTTLDQVKECDERLGY